MVTVLDDWDREPSDAELAELEELEAQYALDHRDWPDEYDFAPYDDDELYGRD